MNTVLEMTDDCYDLAPMNDVVRRSAGAGQAPDAIICQSKPMRHVLSEVQHVAPTSSTVLLLGETGVGKELVAQAIHEASPRRHLPMIRVNCAAIPSTLIESELFGHERGAFTGAVARQVGRFEAAHRSTLFLDEIGDLPLEIQVKLLRVLEERTIERLGSLSPVKIDVRIIAATHRDLPQAVADGTFREDLFYRLNVFPLTVPPLRARASDIPELIWTFIDKLAPKMGKRIDAVDARSLADLQQYPWPGNVRELRNFVEREIILARGTTLAPAAPKANRNRPGRSDRLMDVLSDHIRAVLESCGWRVRGKHGAAEQLGMKPTTLETRMERLGIRRPWSATAPPAMPARIDRPGKPIGSLAAFD